MKSLKIPATPPNLTQAIRDKNESAYLFFPPFPGTQGKNEDIAKAVSNKTSLDTFVVYYTGLSSNPNELFDFAESVNESIQFAKSLLNQYKKLHLVGHSWGGLIALNIFNNLLTPEQRGQLILLAPFTEFPKDGSIESWLIPMATTQEHFRFSHKNPEEVRNNFFSVEHLFPPRKNLDHLKFKDNQIAIIEAINDSDVPNHSTESLYQLLSQEGKTQRFQLEDDHCFTKNKPAILAAVLTAVQIINEEK